MAARHTRDEPVQAEAPEVVGYRARYIGAGIAPLELRDAITELPMSKAGRRQGNETERVHERVDPAVAEAEAGGSLLIDEDG